MAERCPRRLQEQCPRKLDKRGCEIVLHHLFYPKGKYVELGGVALHFRELSINQVPMCKQREEELHTANPDGPPIPSDAVMEHVVNNELDRRRLAVRDLRRP